MSAPSPQQTARTPDLVWHSAPPGLISGFGQQSLLVVRSMQRAGYLVDLSTTSEVLDPALDASRCTIWPAPGLSGEHLVRNATAAFSGSGRRPRALAFTNLPNIEDDRCEGIDLAFWVPFNFSPPQPGLLSYLRDRPIEVLSLTRWAQGALADHGVGSTYIPHTVDPEIFHPDPVLRQVTRDRLGIERDAFVVGVVAANGEWFGNRKSLPEVLAAFDQFRRVRPDAVLYLHTDITGRLLGGIDLEAVMASLGLPERFVRWTTFADADVGLDVAGMAGLFNAFDVLLAPSAGEGFGIPVIEAQACGVPVIVSSWATQAELVGAGWAVGGQARWASWVNSWQFTPSVPAIVEALEAAHAGPRPPLATAAIFANGYHHERVFARGWVPFLDRWIGAPDGRPVRGELLS